MDELRTIIAAAAPLIFASVGETITERSGVVNLSLDGSILLCALTGFAIASETGSVTIGFLAAAGVGMAIALVVALSSIELRLNQIAVGFVLFLLGGELSTFLGQDYVRTPGPSVPAWDIPLLEDVPVLGRLFFQHNVSIYLSFVVVLGSWWFLFHTRQGLALQSVGERPAAAFARGIPVNRYRYLATAVGGALVGAGGAAFSLDVKFGWSEGHTTNFGWIVLAIVIFGGWHPVRAALGCYLFGTLQWLALQLQDDFPSLSQVLPSFPFPLMILTLVLVYRPWFRRLSDRVPALRRILASDAPGALGTAFAPE